MSGRVCSLVSQTHKSHCSQFKQFASRGNVACNNDDDHSFFHKMNFERVADWLTGWLVGWVAGRPAIHYSRGPLGNFLHVFLTPGQVPQLGSLYCTLREKNALWRIFFRWLSTLLPFSDQVESKLDVRSFKGHQESSTNVLTMKGLLNFLSVERVFSNIFALSLTQGVKANFFLLAAD